MPNVRRGENVRRNVEFNELETRKSLSIRLNYARCNVTSHIGNVHLRKDMGHPVQITTWRVEHGGKARLSNQRAQFPPVDFRALQLGTSAADTLRRIPQIMARDAVELFSHFARHDIVAKASVRREAHQGYAQRPQSLVELTHGKNEYPIAINRPTYSADHLFSLAGALSLLNSRGGSNVKVRHCGTACSSGALVGFRLHGSNPARWRSRNNRVFPNVRGDDRIRADDGIVANPDPFQHRGFGSQEDVVANHNR